jgi:hypothetical protein
MRPCVCIALGNMSLRLFIAGDLDVTDAGSNHEYRQYYRPEFELVAREYLSFENLAERAAFVHKRRELANMLMAVRLYAIRRDVPDPRSRVAPSCGTTNSQSGRSSSKT